MKRLILTAVAGAAILAIPASATAIPITVHEKVPVVRKQLAATNIAGELVPKPELVVGTKIVEEVVHVAPTDRDDDGIADSEDDCIGYCPPPEPTYVESTDPAAPEMPTYTDPAVSSAGAIPSYITECESGGDYGAYNPSSGATGAYQIIPSTAAAYGCDLSTPAGQDSCAGEIYAAEGTSAWDCG